jgi:cell division septal protein FtsQ
MARLVTPPPDSTPAEWGKRLAYLVCVLIPVLLLLVLILNDRTKPRTISWEGVQLSSSPPMSRGDFLREVRAVGQLGETLAVEEEGLLERLRLAFSRHEWVEEVKRVSVVRPDSLLVELTFRSPVARLDRTGQSQVIDRQGKVLMPVPQMAMNQLIPLLGWDERNSESMKWLPAAGQLAYQLQRDMVVWKIASIHLVRDLSLDTAELRLKTQANSFIVWQMLKGGNNDEPSVDEKLTRLRIYHERYGNLDAPPGQLLDVRRKEGLERRAITQQ